mgnify:CR=1 FL=1
MTIHSQGDSPISTTAQTVIDEIRSMVPPDWTEDLDLDTSLYDIGLDSLARMEIITRLEKVFGIRFTEDLLFDLETCGDLVDCIDELTGNVPAYGSVGKKPDSVDDEPEQPVDVAPEVFDVSLFPECVEFQQRLSIAETFGLVNPFFRVNQSTHEAIAQIAGNDVIRFTSFDYLGMATDPRVMAAAKEAIDHFGTSASASRLVGGNNVISEELDLEIADLVGTESAITFPSGYGTNASVFGHLFNAKDLILYDELAHNSIAQGAMLSKAAKRSFAHNDYELLDELLTDLRGKYRRVVVAIEGVYSMDGDYPDLEKFIEVKKRHKALLYVDEAHSLGTMGPGGRGICEHFGIDPAEGDLWMGTISKALGSGGGYLAGRAPLMQYLKYTTPSFVFSTACSPPNAAAALMSVKLLKQEPERVARLRERSDLFLKCAQDLGLNTGDSADTPIVPIILGDSSRCIRVSTALLQKGVDAQSILYPAVPESGARIRFFITANHTEEQITRAAQALEECLNENP